ncbi:unnamed protein product [Clonostachys solani]|uniref:Uncharacterized protein n=1 Tax=Clonostachys solani TaxID=160281 RepID=A0A9N9Z1R8_9HYPO|nr:unnamed protein product [Clonostachys solani]
MPLVLGVMWQQDDVYSFENAGIPAGVDIEKLTDIGQWISDELGIPNGSRVGAALVAKKKSTVPAATSSPAMSTTRQWDAVEDTREYRVSRSGVILKTYNTPIQLSTT